MAEKKKMVVNQRSFGRDIKKEGLFQKDRLTPVNRIIAVSGRIGTLGDIVFKVSDKTIQTFDGLKIESKTNYAKHTRHNKKPLLEFQNNDSDTAEFSIYLSTNLGINPLKMLNKIDKYRKQGKILTLIIGGKKYGTKWVITQHTKEYETFDNKGKLLTAKSIISLEEYAER